MMRRLQNFKTMLSLVMATAVVLFAFVRVGPDAAYAPAGVGQWDTAVTQANIAETVCKPGYTDIVRSGRGGEFGAVTQSIRNKVYQRDGKTPDRLPAAQSKCCEVDHYFPLEIGGANVMANLWAESWEHPYGARDKDKVETGLKHLICSGQMKLADAQSCLATDWVACGRSNGFLK